jgi:dTDP-4-dehydrorhamnose 3,5-epimerase
VLVLGAGGQLGRALTAAFSPELTVALGRDGLDLTDTAAVRGFDWGGYEVVLNAAAYTAVDAAETPDGRRAAWAANVTAVADLVLAAREHRFALVHISSDYVFDGTAECHDEGEPFSPLGVYGQTKAAGDALVSTLDAHYLLRTSWVIGDGRNFVRTMADLADRGVQPGVVDDQFGRLTFTGELVRAIRHLLAVDAPYGTYNVTNSGPATTWADIAASVFEARGRSRSAVRPVSTEEYGAGKALAPRPQHSLLDLAKLTGTGFEPADAGETLRDYLSALPPAPGGVTG